MLKPSFQITVAFAVLIVLFNASVGVSGAVVTHDHPRLLMDASKLMKIKSQISFSPKFAEFSDTLLKRAKESIKKGPPEYKPPSPDDQEMLWEREVGNQLSDLAMSYAISGERVYLEAASKWSMQAISYQVWGNDKTGGAGMDLAAGHLLFGLATVYDTNFD